MRVLLLPFYSQQDKRTGKFLLNSDSGVRAYSYMGRRMVEAGWKPTIAVPAAHQRADNPAFPHPAIEVPYEMCIDNLRRRLQWEPDWLAGLDYDLILTTHEFIAYPLRCLKPEVRVVMECGIRSDTAWPETAALFPLAQAAADAVHFNSQLLADECTHARRKFVWPFGYEDQPCSTSVRDVDVLFPARASSTGYSNHRLLVEALRDAELRVVATDPTSYLRANPSEMPEEWVPREQLNRADYTELLARSKVVVGLTANGYGGYAFQEAVAVGCVPVALRCPEYEELLGVGWPYYCDANAASLKAAVNHALLQGWPEALRHSVQARVAEHSYAVVWRTARCDIESLLE